MENVTVEQVRNFVVVLVAVLGFIVLLWNAVKALKEIAKPKEDMERWCREVDMKLKNDHERLKSMEDGNKVICRGILALLSHEINGNSTEKLTASQTEITNYLIDR